MIHVKLWPLATLSSWPLRGLGALKRPPHPGEPRRAGTEGQVGPASRPSRVPWGQLPPQACLALKLLCLLSHLHLCHRRVSKNQNIELGKKTAVLGKAAVQSRPQPLRGSQRSRLLGCGCHRGYGPRGAQLRSSLLHDAFLVPCGMTPPFWVDMPHFEPEEL